MTYIQHIVIIFYLSIAVAQLSCLFALLTHAIEYFAKKELMWMHVVSNIIFSFSLIGVIVSLALGLIWKIFN